MAAIVFSVTKDDTTTGASRCLKRMGVLRGDKVSMRFRRLSLECTRNKTEFSDRGHARQGRVGRLLPGAIIGDFQTSSVAF